MVNDAEEEEEEGDWCFGLAWVEEQVVGVRGWDDLEDALAIGDDVDFGIRTGADIAMQIKGRSSAYRVRRGDKDPCGYGDDVG